MRENFQKSLSIVLLSEGGWANNPSDPGGPTMEGITQKIYDAFRQSVNLGSRSVKFISASERDSIYKAQFWDAISGDLLPSGLDLALFDEAVLSGPVQAARDLQRVLRVKVDGHIGLVTLASAQGLLNRKLAVNELCNLRLGLIHRLVTFSLFGKGWEARIARVRSAALSLT